MAKVHWYLEDDGWHFDTPYGDEGGPFETRKEAMNAGYDSIRAAEAPAPEPPPKKTATKPKAPEGDDGDDG